MKVSSVTSPSPARRHMLLEASGGIGEQTDQQSNLGERAESSGTPGSVPFVARTVAGVGAISAGPCRAGAGLRRGLIFHRVARGR